MTFFKGQLGEILDQHVSILKEGWSLIWGCLSLCFMGDPIYLYNDYDELLLFFCGVAPRLKTEHKFLKPRRDSQI